MEARARKRDRWREARPPCVLNWTATKSAVSATRKWVTSKGGSSRPPAAAGAASCEAKGCRPRLARICVGGHRQGGAWQLDQRLPHKARRPPLALLLFMPERQSSPLQCARMLTARAHLLRCMPQLRQLLAQQRVQPPRLLHLFNLQLCTQGYTCKVHLCLRVEKGTWSWAAAAGREVGWVGEGEAAWAPGRRPAVGAAFERLLTPAAALGAPSPRAHAGMQQPLPGAWSALPPPQSAKAQRGDKHTRGAPA